MRTTLRTTLLLAAAWPAFAAGPAQSGLARWVAAELERNPAVAEARAARDAARARETAAGRPLYNPELELELERAETDTGAVGLSQTIDWAGKRDARARVAAYERLAAEAALESASESVAADLLRALADLRAAERALALAERRAALTGELEAIARRRFEAGDLPRTDLALARLAHVEARLQRAEAADARAEAQAALRALTGAVPRELPALPGAAPEPPAQAPGTDRLRRTLPALRRLEAGLAARRAEVNLRRRERRPDPTVQVRGGREASDPLLGLAVSVPLFVRNDFRAEVTAAERERMAAEAALARAMREALARAAAAAERYRLVAETWRSWREEAAPSLDEQVALLHRQWEAGELGTTEYLVQLGQALDTRAAAVRLERRLWRAWFEWLEATGRVRAWLGIDEQDSTRRRAP